MLQSTLMSPISLLLLQWFSPLRVVAQGGAAGVGQSVLDIAKIGGGIGSMVRDVKSLKSAMDPDHYDPVTLSTTASPARLGGGGLLDELWLGGGEIQKIADCNPEVHGVCCILPNYCVPLATCEASKVTTHISDLLKAVPTCRCPKGYKGDGRTKGTGCQDVDECADGEAPCEDICTNTKPGFECGCRPGYRLAENGYSCDDIDECKEKTARCSHQCTNIPGSYVCACPRGYVLQGDSFTCHSIDECALGMEIAEYKLELLMYRQSLNLLHNRREQLSVNQSAESVSISRPVDFTAVSALRDPPTLSAKAQTAMGTLEICEYPTLCVNLPGAYTCSCPPGYQVNVDHLATCVDIDECSPGASAKQSEAPKETKWQLAPGEPAPSSLVRQARCLSSIEQSGSHLSQMCINKKGTFECQCAPGFREVSGEAGSMRALEEQAQRFKEGKDGARAILEGVVAQQTATYTSALKRAHQLECVDIDECAEGEKSPCSGGTDPGDSSTATCVNKIGAYECLCSAGYTFSSDVRKCVDIDECQSPSSNLCDVTHGETCVNVPGTYYCTCRSGFASDSVSSLETQRVRSAAPVPAVTRWYPGNLTSLRCAQLDECGIHYNGVCAYQCQNVAPSLDTSMKSPAATWRCVCPRGFKPSQADETRCEDIDECALNVCPPDTPCLNLPGSYLCGCPINFAAAAPTPGSQQPEGSGSHPGHLPMDVRRWLFSVNHIAQGLSGAGPSRFNSTLTDLKNALTNYMSLSEGSLLRSDQSCVRINICSDLPSWLAKTFNVADCPQPRTCRPPSDTMTPLYQCECPRGGEAKQQSSSGSAMGGGLSAALPFSFLSPRNGGKLLDGGVFRGGQGFAAQGLVKAAGSGLLGDLLARGSSVASGRKLAEDDTVAPLLDLTPLQTAADSSTVPFLLSDEQKALAKELGFWKVSTSGKEGGLAVPLWLFMHLDWAAQVDYNRQLQLQSCPSLDPCKEAAKAVARGEASKICRSRSEPCCQTRGTTGSFACLSRQGLIFGNCPSGSIDLSR